MIDEPAPLELAALRARAASPADTVRAIYRRIAAGGDTAVWIHLLPQEAALDVAKRLEARRGENLPLFGVPFAVKDNIDVAGMPTTAACPAYSYTPKQSALAVQRLVDVGAICLGKTNLDQFATGLSGVRSPYGAVASAFDSRYAAGGSSSGSAVAVAAHLVSFALGTDTGGSGRIPAGFNNVVGLKPTVGRVSNRGLVPNCRTLDCVSVFALTCADAQEVLRVIEGFDPADPFSRAATDGVGAMPPRFRFGMPDALEFFGDSSAAALFEAARARLERLGGVAVTVDFAPFREAGTMMFDGPWVAERWAALRAFIERQPGTLLPVTRTVMESAKRWSAADAFAARYRLAELKRSADALWRDIDVLVVPTAPTATTIAALEADPIRLNNRNGHYSYFVNLLDLAAVAVPNGFLGCGVPMGITLIGPAWSDDRLVSIGARYHRALGLPPGIITR